MNNANLSISFLYLSRNTQTSPLITNTYRYLAIKNSRFEQQFSPIIRSSLPKLNIQNTKFGKFLSTVIILDSLTYEKTNFSTQNIPITFNSITSSDGIVKFNDVLFYEIQQSYLEACAFQCTSNIEVECNHVSFVNLFLTSGADSSGACFRLERTKNCSFTSCCFYKVAGYSKASQICGLVRVESIHFKKCSFNALNTDESYSPGFFIDRSLVNVDDSNYTRFISKRTAVIYYVSGNEELKENLICNCIFVNNTGRNLSVASINGRTDKKVRVEFYNTYFYFNTQIFQNSGNMIVYVKYCYICKSPFGEPEKYSMNLVLGDTDEFYINYIENIEEAIMIPAMLLMKATCKKYYYPTETKTLIYPTKAQLPYGNLDFVTKKTTVDTKTSIYIVAGIIIGIILITSSVIVITQRSCPLFTTPPEQIYLSDDSTEIDEDIYDQEYPILKTEQKLKIDRRMSDEFRGLKEEEAEAGEQDAGEENPPRRRRRRRRRVKRRRKIEEESRTSSRASSRHSRGAANSSKNPSDSPVQPALDDPKPRRYNETRADRGSGSRASHMRVVRTSAGSFAAPVLNE